MADDEEGRVILSIHADPENVQPLTLNVQPELKADVASGNSSRDGLFAGSLGCGNDFVEALITAQRIPARIGAEIAFELQHSPLSLEMPQEF